MNLLLAKIIAGPRRVVADELWYFNRNRKEDPLSFWLNTGFALVVVAYLAVVAFTPWESHPLPQQTSAVVVPSSVDTSSGDSFGLLPSGNVATIEPSVCTTSTEGVTAQIVTTEQDGTYCSVTFSTSLHGQIVGIGGWCDAVNTTIPAPEGNVTIGLKAKNRPQGPDTFTFFTGHDDTQYPQVQIYGVVIDVFEIVHTGSVPCGTVPAEEDHN